MPKLEVIVIGTVYDVPDDIVEGNLLQLTVQDCGAGFGAGAALQQIRLT